MALQTGAGSAIAICVAAPATQDATGFAALTFTEAGNCEKIGQIGATFAKTEFQPLKGAKQKLKGSADYGSVSPQFALDETDAGQALAKTAGNDESNKLYSFRVTLQSGTKVYFQGRVFGWPITIDGADPVTTATPVVEICSKPVEVAAS
ncbi:hypothetical protein [Sphingomonas sp. Leaf62]|uniref:hypothetical protein n=1 Tax=Sphingomonas sp. Leaf62 TaxID=1736228 RepID=UPI0006F82864|nr:hypothetical protein [Sphingomonas sp. Leaf62]KQN77878.1 hypothetical protein ASE91_14265 [Sphingomonas sp. Leaf62]